MYCEKCGKQLADGVAFCDGCGAPQKAAPVQETPVAAESTKKGFDFGKIKGAIAGKIAGLTKKQKMIGGGIIGGVLALIIILIIILCQPKGIKLDKYITVTSSGYNNYATVNYDIDEEALCRDVLGEKVIEQYQATIGAEYLDLMGSFVDMESAMQANPQLSKIYKTYTDMMAISNAISVSVTMPEGKHNSGLSNDDVVVYTISFDETVAKKYDIKAKTREYSYKLEGLSDAATFNLLEAFGANVEGVNGYGVANLTSTAFDKTIGNVNFKVEEDNSQYIYYTVYGANDGEVVRSSYYYVTLSETSGLSNGAVVTVGADASSSDLQQYGVILEGVSKDVTVEGLSDPVEFDVLSNFKVVFSGVDGDGNAKIVPVGLDAIEVGDMSFSFQEDSYYLYYDYKDSDYGGTLYISLDSKYDLSNGDTVKMYLDYDEDYFARNGVIMTNLSTEITVEGLGAYMTTTKDVDFDDIAAIYREQIENKLYDDWGRMVHGSYWGSYDDQEIGDDFKLYKAILTTPKSTSSYDKNNLYLIYTVKLDDDELEKPTKYYFCAKVEDVVVDAEGVIDVEKDYYENIYTGYTDYDELYDDYIKSFSLNIEEATLKADK